MWWTAVQQEAFSWPSVFRTPCRYGWLWRHAIILPLQRSKSLIQHYFLKPHTVALPFLSSVLPQWSMRIKWQHPLPPLIVCIFASKLSSLQNSPSVSDSNGAKKDKENSRTKRINSSTQIQRCYDVANDNAICNGWDSSSLRSHFKTSSNIASDWSLSKNLRDLIMMLAAVMKNALWN